MTSHQGITAVDRRRFLTSAAGLTLALTVAPEALIYSEAALADEPAPVILRATRPPLSFSGPPPPCHSEERSDEESLEGEVSRDEHRSFAEPVLSEAEGLRMTERRDDRGESYGT
jgi:hypothetical protein